jgi:hypothetical protein
VLFLCAFFFFFCSIIERPSLQIVFLDGEEAFEKWSDTDSLYVQCHSIGCRECVFLFFVFCLCFFVSLPCLLTWVVLLLVMVIGMVHDSWHRNGRPKSNSLV